MRVINLFAGPGAGKSTTAAGLFYLMKKKGLKVELVTEYAKDCVYENSLDKMRDQLYIFAKQNRRLERLRDKVDYVITDSPLLLCIYYGCKYGKMYNYQDELFKSIFDTYNNVNFFIERTKPFHEYGRLGDLDSAKEADYGILDILNRYDIAYLSLEDNDIIYQTILDKLNLKQ